MTPRHIYIESMGCLIARNRTTPEAGTPDVGPEIGEHSTARHPKAMPVSFPMPMHYNDEESLRCASREGIARLLFDASVLDEMDDAA